MPERARPGFGSALVERDDAVLRRHIRHEIGDRLAAGGAGHFADRGPRHIGRGGERVADRGVARRGAAIERVLERFAGPGAGEIGPHEGRAHRHAGVVRRRRHP